jgi:hypothetical protein
VPCPTPQPAASALPWILVLKFSLNSIQRNNTWINLTDNSYIEFFSVLII